MCCSRHLADKARSPSSNARIPWSCRKLRRLRAVRRQGLRLLLRNGRPDECKGRCRRCPPAVHSPSRHRGDGHRKDPAYVGAGHGTAFPNIRPGQQGLAAQVVVDQHPPIAGLRSVLQRLMQQIAVEEDHAADLQLHLNPGRLVEPVRHVVVGVKLVRVAVLLRGIEVVLLPEARQNPHAAVVHQPPGTRCGSAEPSPAPCSFLQEVVGG